MSSNQTGMGTATGSGSIKSTNEIRKTFLDFFAANGHSVVPSASLVPVNDPTLMFTNAGMVPFKNVFTGAESRPYSQAVSSQKCVRAGGKHNDLDNVGYTARHHTFFEMLGNFSFGDYFKDQAISLAWELITKEYGIDPDRLTVTVYHDDDAAYDLWRKIAGLPEDRIIRIATNDNFWSMGEVGPCGPCSEIFYDHGDHIWGGPPGSADEDGDRFVEIWNLVFMQYEQRSGADRVDLPRPSIDTGMGLERIAALLQGIHDNYETDIFKRLIAASIDATGAKETDATRSSHRVIADHLRACSFLIADGVLPSNEGRGYVLRRIMRRAMRHAHLLGAKDLVMHQLAPSLVGEMGQAFPELIRAERLIEETLKLEESKFRQMLEKGMRLLDDEVGKISGDTLAGDVAFKLYDTFGFPLDLTQDALRSQSLKVDVDGFNKSMEQQRAKARAAWSGSGDAATETVWFDLHDQHGATEFVGYTSEQAEGQIIALVKGGELVEKAAVGDEVAVVTNQTPFYGESGGQMGDTGSLAADGTKVTVTDTMKKIGALHVHVCRVDVGSIEVGQVLDMTVDGHRRRQLRANHSATHVLHEVLRRELGDHVTQKGSLVAPEKLRFDISHPKAIKDAELEAIEAAVNDVVRNNSGVQTRLLSFDDAVEAGAMALFGEKYGDEVRVVSMGRVVSEGAADFSVELCGGTHVDRLGEIGLFTITSESAVSSGVRRIEALTGAAAHAHLIKQQKLLKAAAAMVKSSPDELGDRVAALQAERKSLEKELAEARKQAAMGGGASAGPETKLVNGTQYLGQVLAGVSPKDLRGLADDTKKRIGSGVVVLIAVNDGKAAVLVGVTDDLTDTISAVDLVRVAAATVGGKGGGGRADMAQAGGPDGANALAALDAVEAALAG